MSERLPSPRIVLAALMASAACLLLWETRGQTFFADEWAFFAGYGGHRLDVLLQPDAGNLVVAPVLLYKALLHLFGGGTYVPERLVWVALDLISAGLFFALARKRVGDWVALAPTALLLVFGAAHEVLAGPLGITVLLTVSAGLGVLLCLEHRGLRADIAASLLLGLALASYTAGVAFAAGAAVELVVVRGRDGLRRLWVVAAPLVLYATWRLWALRFHETQITVDNVLSLPSSVAASLAAAMASISGTFRPPGFSGIATGAGFDSKIGWVLALAVLGLVAARVHQRDSRPIDRRVWVYAALVLAYWLAIGSNLGPLRAPEASRYQYPGAVFVLLLAVQLGAGLRICRGAAVGIAVLLAGGLAGNLANLHEAALFLRVNSDENRAQLGALGMARAHVVRGLPVEPLSGQLEPTDDMVIPIGSYLSAADAYGSPAYSLAAIGQRTEQVREHADAELVHALGLLPVPGRSRDSSPAASPPRPEAVEAARLLSERRCWRIVPLAAGASATFAVPPGGFLLSPAAGPPASIALRRFAASFVAQTPAPPSGTPSAVRIPTDAGPGVWHLKLTTSVPVRVCALGSG